MSSFLDSLKIRSLRKQVDAWRLACNALASQFENAPTSAEKSKIAQEYDMAMKRAHAMQFLLELQERKKKSADEKAL